MKPTHNKYFGSSDRYGQHPNSGGTREFRPPEDIQNQVCDLYALGITNYILGTGDYTGEVQNLQNGTVKLFGPKRDVATLRRVILRACHARPEIRFQSAKEIRDAIESASRVGLRRAAVGAIIAALIVLAATPLLFMWLGSPGQDRPAATATRGPASSAVEVRITAADIELVRPANWVIAKNLDHLPTRCSPQKKTIGCA